MKTQIKLRTESLYKLTYLNRSITEYGYWVAAIALMFAIGVAMILFG
jgi:hypothetical protein